jgi:hypothetical protein
MFLSSQPKAFIKSVSGKGTTWVFKGKIMFDTEGACGPKGNEIDIHAMRTIDGSDATVPRKILEVGKTYILEGVCSGGKIFFLNPCGPSFLEDGGRPTDDFKKKGLMPAPKSPPEKPNELVIFYEVTSTTDSHMARAKALAEESGNCPYVQITATLQAPKYEGLKTAIFWGHGTPVGLCGLDEVQFSSFVIALKKQNPGLTRIEFLSCNSRHTHLWSDSYTEKLIPLLKKDEGTKNLVVMALPMRTAAQGGGARASSILTANVTTKSWCYTSGKDEPGKKNHVVVFFFF